MLTSNYNVYFNGVEAFNDGVGKIRTAYKNDYSAVLPVYEFSDATAAKSGASDMETALKKGHKLIQLHSITAKPKKKDNPSEKYKRFAAQEEFNPYVAESYLLLGKANVVLHEEDEAVDYFDYLSRKYEGERTSYEGKIWKSIAYAQKDLYNNAVSALESYDLDGVAPEELYGEYMAAYANIHIRQSQYREAIPYMEGAVKNTTDRHTKRRYKYILAQLYRHNGENEKAAPLFLELSRGMADYNMAFAAKLDLATVATTPEELAVAEKKLRKMAKDSKNNEQLDQIYYSLGKMELNKGNKNAAIDDFRQSVQKSVSNDNQKGLSFMALADIYIAEPQYIPTSEALDSAAFFLDDSNLRKKEAQQNSQKYKPLADQLRIIENNDSLLRVANMSEKDRNKVIKSILDKIEDERRAAEAARQAEMNETMSQSEYYQLTSNRTGSSSMNKWYFYNTSTVSAGRSTFLSKWGRRKNEDNWRRGDKSSHSVSDLEDGFGDEENQSAGAQNSGSQQNAQQQTDNKPQAPIEVTRESLLAGLPLTVEAQAECNRLIDDALFASGSILYDDIRDYTSATSQFSRQTERYPKSPNRYNTLVMLYFSQMKQGDLAGAETTAAIIRREFGNSDFAQYLKSDNYFETQNLQRAEREQRYEQTYNAYLGGRYAEAIASATSAMTDTANRQYEPKYLIVRSLAYAKNAQKSEFRNDLVTITQRYVGSEEDSLARVFLAKLDEGLEPVKATPYVSPLAEAGRTAEATQAQQNTYAFNPDTTHTVVCVVDAGMQNRAQYLIADYNFSNYIIDDFDISMVRLADDRQVLVIEGFENARRAMEYFYSLREQKFWSEISSEALPTIYAVSDNNTRMLILSDLGGDYDAFFNDNYLKNKY